MNDVIQINHVTLAQRAERIRSLVNVARGCVVEIGHELIAAKAERPHGEWRSWLKDEFGWSHDTADRYMQVAGAFQMSHAATFDGLTIDATALYALAAPDVPQAVRDDAVARAEAGEQISKTTAEKMIADAIKPAVEQAVLAERKVMADAIAAAEQKAADLTEQMAIAATDDAALYDAAATLEALQEAYEEAVEERDRLVAEVNNPSEDQVIRLVSMLSKRKPGKLMLVSIASALNRTITYNGTEYSPVSEAELRKYHAQKLAADVELQKLSDGGPAQWHRVLDALRTINRLPSVDALFASRHRGIDHALQSELPNAGQWLDNFERRFCNADAGAGPGGQLEADRGPDQTQAVQGRQRVVRNSRS